MAPVASFFRDPVLLSFVDEDNHALAELTNPPVVPRVGENVRIAGRPFLVERVGYDIPDDQLERIWVVLRAI